MKSSVWSIPVNWIKLMLNGPEKILPFDELLQALAEHRQHHRKIIFSHGVFDMLHRGHVTLLAEAKKLGGILVVGVESDSNVKILKGPDRPIHSQQARLFVLSHLVPVDYLFLIPEYDNPHELNTFYSHIYQQLQADILATCVEAGKFGLIKKAHANQASMEFVNIPEIYELNTSKVIALLKSRSDK